MPDDTNKNLENENENKYIKNAHIEENLNTHSNLSPLEEINQKSYNINSGKFIKANSETFDYESNNNYEYYFNIQNTFDLNKNCNDIINDNYLIKNFFLIRNKNDYVHILDSPASMKAVKKLNYSIKELIRIPFDKFSIVFSEYKEKGKEFIKKIYNEYNEKRRDKIVEVKFERMNVMEFEGNNGYLKEKNKDNSIIDFIDRIKMVEAKNENNSTLKSEIEVTYNRKEKISCKNIKIFNNEKSHYNINNQNIINDKLGLNYINMKKDKNEISNDDVNNSYKDNSLFFNIKKLMDKDPINNNTIKDNKIINMDIDLRKLEDNLLNNQQKIIKDFDDKYSELKNKGNINNFFDIKSESSKMNFKDTNLSNKKNFYTNISKSDTNILNNKNTIELKKVSENSFFHNNPNVINKLTSKKCDIEALKKQKEVVLSNLQKKDNRSHALTRPYSSNGRFF